MNKYTQVALDDYMPPPCLDQSAADAVPMASERAGGDAWRHSSGIWLPRGSVVVDKLDSAEIDALAARSAARGAVSAALDARKVKRSESEAAQLEAFCEWLAAEGLDLFGVVSFSDDYAARYGIYSLKRGLDDVWAGLNQVPLRRGQRVGFRGKYVLAGEWHPSGRLVPHVHLALESAGCPPEKVCGELYRYFYGSRGRSRFEPMRDVDTATLYALKDTVKASARDADCVRFRLWHPKRRGS